MAEKIKRFGINYSDNYIDPYLVFENEGISWTVSDGTGLGIIAKGVSFVGDMSLYISNTDVVNDITVTSSEQSTIIPVNGNFGFSFYLYKTEALQPITGNVKIFKDAVLLDTQTFALGSTDVDEDDNEVWVRFISDTNYNLSTSDEITFTFTIDGVPGSVLPSLDLRFDGLMLYQNKRDNNVCPVYTRPYIVEPKQRFGVYNYNDDATSTTPIALVQDTWTNVTNDGLGSATILGGGYDDVTPYDIATNLFDFSDLEVYDKVIVRFDGEVTTSSGNESVLVRMLLSVGSLDIPLTFIATEWKTSTGTYPLMGEVTIPIYSENVRTTSAKLQCKTDGATSELVVNGWSVVVEKRMS